MAKSAISADQLEAIISTVLAKTLPEILIKVLDKFETQLDRLIDKFDAKIDKISGDLHALYTRVDTMEAKIVQQSVQAVQPPASTESATDVAGIVELASRAMISMENEKEEIRSRSRNIIISGLLPSSTQSDQVMFEEFCEGHLTVKPRVVRSRRIGKDKAKLCLTLETPEAVVDLLESSSLLRNATDPGVRRIYFNRDLTKQQADAEYKRRCAAREKRSQSNTAINSELNPGAVPFRGGNS
jgi:hypothetical protein